MGTRSTGKWCSRSHRATCGATSASAKSRTSGAELLVVLAQLEHRWPFVDVEDRPTLLDVDVNVKHDGRRDNPVRGPRHGRRRRRRPGCPGRTWTIAEVAEQFGVTHRTVRHYEDLGLISPERRGTTRVYHRRDRTRLNLILRGKRLGFPLEEIRTIIDMYDEQPGEAGQLHLPAGPDRRPPGRAGAPAPGHRGLPRRAGRPRAPLRGRPARAALTPSGLARRRGCAGDRRSGCRRADLGAHGVQLGEEGELERAAQERRRRWSRRCRA